jgi:hypothetical protein
MLTDAAKARPLRSGAPSVSTSTCTSKGSTPLRLSHERCFRRNVGGCRLASIATVFVSHGHSDRVEAGGLASQKPRQTGSYGVQNVAEGCSIGKRGAAMPRLGPVLRRVKRARRNWWFVGRQAGSASRRLIDAFCPRPSGLWSSGASAVGKFAPANIAVQDMQKKTR